MGTPLFQLWDFALYQTWQLQFFKEEKLNHETIIL